MDPETATKLVLKSVPAITENYEKVYDPVKDKAKEGYRKAKKMRGNQRGGYDEYSSDESDYGRPRRSYTDGHRDRSRRRSDRGDLVESRRVIRTSDGRTRSVGRDGRDYGRGSRRDYSDSEASRSPPRRSKSKRRQSLGDKALAALGLGAGAGAAADSRRRRSRSSSSSRSRDRQRRRRSSRGGDGPRSSRSTAAPPSRGYYGDDRTPARYKPAGYAAAAGAIGNARSESPRGGSGNQVARRGNQSVMGGTTKRSSSSSSSSSDVCSSSEDERKIKQSRKKEWLTAGFAAVATVHAAHGLYSSMEARDKRMMEVASGEMSPEEAKKKRNKARVQDAAAIGIAALGIKGAYSEWQEVQESRKEMSEMEKEKAERHEKRMRKAEKYGYYRGHQPGDDSRDRYRDRSRPRRRERSV